MGTKSSCAEEFGKFHLKIIVMCYKGNFSMCTFADVQREEAKGKKNVVKTLLLEISKE